MNIGPYEVVRPLGAGGMGEVLLARDTRLHRQVALKRLLADDRHQPDSRARLLREAEALAALTHPHIAAVYDVLDHEDKAYIVMEYVPGESLADRVRRGALPVQEALRLGGQMADALGAAHERHIVHRDLKPANVIVTPDGNAKVLDFGVAKLVRTEATTLPSTTGGRVVGTPEYMSPEQLAGAQVDARSDIYSLGTVMFELLTGRRPFLAPDVLSLARAVMSEPPPDVRTCNRAVSQPVAAAVQRMLAKEPDSRPQSAYQVAQELARLTAAAAAPAPVAGTMLDATRRLVTSVSGVRFVITVLLLIVLGAVLIRLLPRGATTNVTTPGRPVIAVLPFEDLSPQSNGRQLGDGMTAVLTATLATGGGLTVVPPSEARRSAEIHEWKLRQVADELAATHLIEGQVQHMDGRIVLTATIVNGASIRILWSGRFEKADTDIIALQQEVSAAIADGLVSSDVVPAAPRTAAASVNDPQAFADYAQARSFLERADVPGNLDRAERLFRSAIEKAPRFALAHAGLGETYWARYLGTRNASELQRARIATQEAFRLSQDLPMVRYTLALIYDGTGLKKEASEELDAILSRDPQNDSAHRVYGRILAEQGEFDRALTHLREALRLRPAYWLNHAELGLAFYDRGRYGEAVRAFTRVTELQPDSAWGYQMLGTAYHAQDRYAEALEYYAKANAMQPTSEAHSNIGTIYYVQGRYHEAAQAYLAATEIDRTSPVTFRNLGDAYRRLKETAKAREAYLRAIDLTTQRRRDNPRDAAMLSLQALCELRLGRREAALRHIRAAEEIGLDRETTYRKAVVMAGLGRREEALAALETAIAKGYNVRLAASDEEFAALRSHPRFRRLVGDSDGGL